MTLPTNDRNTFIATAAMHIVAARVADDKVYDPYDVIPRSVIMAQELALELEHERNAPWLETETAS